MPFKYDKTVVHNSRTDGIAMQTEQADSGVILETSSLYVYLWHGAQEVLHKKSFNNIAQRSSIIDARQSVEQ